MPNHVRPRWLSVASRMQSVACQQEGYAILTFKILVGPDGNPALWMMPSMKKIEPKRGSSDFLNMLLESLDEDT